MITIIGKKFVATIYSNIYKFIILFAMKNFLYPVSSWQTTIFTFSFMVLAEDVSSVLFGVVAFYLRSFMMRKQKREKRQKRKSLWEYTFPKNYLHARYDILKDNFIVLSSFIYLENVVISSIRGVSSSDHVRNKYDEIASRCPLLCYLI